MMKCWKYFPFIWSSRHGCLLSLLIFNIILKEILASSIPIIIKYSGCKADTRQVIIIDMNGVYCKSKGSTDKLLNDFRIIKIYFQLAIQLHIFDPIIPLPGIQGKISMSKLKVIYRCVHSIVTIWATSYKQLRCV